MHLLTLGTAVLLILAVAVTRTQLRSMFFNPLFCFVAVWFVTFALYQLDAIIGFFVVVPGTQESLLILLGLVSFVAGSLVAAFPGPQLRPRALPVQEETLRQLARSTVLLLPVFGLGVAWKYVTVASVYGGLLQNLPQIRDASSLGLVSFPLLSRAMTLFGYVIILNLAILLVFRPRPQFVVYAAVAVLLSMVNDMTTAARGSTFNAMLLLACCAVLAAAARSQRLTWRQILLGAGVFVLGLVLTTAVLYLRSDRAMSFLARLMLDGYIYLVGNVPAMAYFFSNPWPSAQPLVWTFAGLYQLIDMLAGLLGMPTLMADEFVTQYAPISWIGPFNSSGFLTYFHSDLGGPGVVLFSFLMGFICMYRFLLAILHRRVLDIQIAALLMGLAIFSVKGIMTNGMSFWVTWAIIALQHRIVGARSAAWRRRIDPQRAGADA